MAVQAQSVAIEHGKRLHPPVRLRAALTDTSVAGGGHSEGIVIATVLLRDANALSGDIGVSALPQVNLIAGGGRAEAGLGLPSRGIPAVIDPEKCVAIPLRVTTDAA